jgi:hypothetical protein
VRIAAPVIVALLVAGCGAGSRTVTTTTTVTKTVTQAPPQPQPSAAPGPENATYFGQPVSVSNAGSGKYLLVVKPESYLVGVTANVVFAQQQGKACAPLSCPGVDDDRVVVPAGSQNLTFVLPATATGTVLEGAAGMPTKVTGTQLAALVGGAKTPKLVEPLVSGVWLAVDVDKVTSFAQQFQP